MKQINDTWVVYRHTTPSHKVYIGITHHKNPLLRWGKNGRNYSDSQVFTAAIKKYGWNNIKHEILLTDLSELDAKLIEMTLIAYYKELNLCYNMTIGGEGHNFGLNSNSAEYKTKRSQIYRKEHPDYDKNQYLLHKESKKEAARKYYRENREKILEYKKNDISTKEKARLRAAEWRRNHPEYMKNYMKEYNNNKKLKEN